jgi:hypothetical protein
LDCRVGARQSNRAGYRWDESDVLAVCILPQSDGCQRVRTKHPKLNRTAVETIGAFGAIRSSNRTSLFAGFAADVTEITKHVDSWNKFGTNSV